VHYHCCSTHLSTVLFADVTPTSSHIFQFPCEKRVQSISVVAYVTVALYMQSAVSECAVGLRCCWQWLLVSCKHKQSLMWLSVDVFVRRCMMCSSSGFPCHWCVVTHKCELTSKRCGGPDMMWMVRPFLVVCMLDFDLFFILILRLICALPTIVWPQPACQRTQIFIQCKCACTVGWESHLLPTFYGHYTGHMH